VGTPRDGIGVRFRRLAYSTTSDEDRKTALIEGGEWVKGGEGTEDMKVLREGKRKRVEERRD